LTRIEAGDIAWSFEKLRLDELIGETLEGLAPLAAERGIRLEPAPSSDRDATAQANPEKIQRVLFNLIQNGLQHTASGGSVSVGASVEGDEVAVQVTDSGSGIAAEDFERIFEPLWRGADAQATRPDGSGLGLPLARAIVEAHEGRISVTSASPAGTEVTFTLPIARERRHPHQAAPLQAGVTFRPGGAEDASSVTGP
jgi:two-component system sensor histidine kinase BaeS